MDTRAAGHGQLGVTVEGPVEVTLNCRDMGNGTCDIYYLPTECGDYTVNITFNDRHILGSPFQALIFPTPNLDHVKVTGAGIELHGKVVGLDIVGFSLSLLFFTHIRELLLLIFCMKIDLIEFVCCFSLDIPPSPFRHFNRFNLKSRLILLQRYVILLFV